ncbi:MAG: ATP-binding cassette domain-containing protein [Candidatus Eremiobacterota bacterium]
MIRLEGVSKTYNGRAALHPTNLSVPAERSVALIGPSGCGKSTLLRLVIGLIHPDSGSVQVDETPMEPATARELRLRMGYVIQDGGLFPHLTAGQNVTLMARQLKWPADRIRERVETLRELVSLSGDMLTRYPAQLSGGQRQRVGIMRALMLDPRVLLLDEPMGALDPVVRSKLQEDLQAIVRGLRKTVLMVTHDMSEAAFLGDEIVLMREGRVIQRGPLADLTDRPSDPFVTEFLKAQRV